MSKWSVTLEANVQAVCCVEVEADNLAEAKELACDKAANGDWEVLSNPPTSQIWVIDAQSTATDKTAR